MQFKILLQYLAPQHLLSRFAGLLAECRIPWFKKVLINYFIRRYQIDLTLAVEEDREKYANFNEFFTRKLKPALRPIAEEAKAIVSPVDGTISQMGLIHNEAIFQAKGSYYSLNTLLGNDDTLTDKFKNGSFATIYLAPKDYHRVHMPVTGQLRETHYIPGKLFSVNQYTTHLVPNLFSRNERLVCLFETEIGPMVVILVGAMLVGSIQTVWSQKVDHRNIVKNSYKEDEWVIKRGEELGLFKMGSTVILLFPENRVEWEEGLKEDSSLCYGRKMGTCSL